MDSHSQVGCVRSGGTSAVDLLTIAYRALSVEEQVEALARMTEIRAMADAGEHSETQRMIGSLQRAYERLGEPPTPDTYRAVRKQLAQEGVEIEPLSRLIRHFGTWRLAKEAVDLSAVTTARRIEARFRSRRLGKVWRYTEETLGATLARAVAETGRVPQVAEFEWWRQRTLELARAAGDDALHLPSATPYRRRWGTWEKALLHFGHTSDEVAERLERT